MPDKVDIEKQADYYRMEHERSYGGRWITYFAPEPTKEKFTRPTTEERKMIRVNWDKIKHQLRGFGNPKAVGNLVINSDQLQNKKRQEIEKLAKSEHSEDLPF